MHKKIMIEWMDEKTESVVIDKRNGARIHDGVVTFGRTEDGRWHELVTVPLVNLRKWG